MKRPFNRSFWVEPGKLLAGCYPGSLDYPEKVSKLTALASCGVRHFVDLTDPWEQNTDGVELDPYLPTFRFILSQMTSSYHISFQAFPIPDNSVISNQDMTNLLALIDQMIEDYSGVIYVHCRGGYGRTGMVIGCWLTKNHLISYRGRGLEILPSFGFDGVDKMTRAQLDFVKNWKNR